VVARSEAKREGSSQAALVARGLRESALWVFGALAVILFVALASYDPADPAFSSTGQQGPVVNLIGPFGAWLADLFFVLFGGPAYLFPLMLAFAGWSVYRDRGSHEPVDRR
jgi:S-DNA-T family DNA segregation ATPase FtsK/SpoIIIE